MPSVNNEEKHLIPFCVYLERLQWCAPHPDILQVYISSLYADIVIDSALSSPPVVVFLK